MILSGLSFGLAPEKILATQRALYTSDMDRVHIVASWLRLIGLQQ